MNAMNGNDCIFDSTRTYRYILRREHPWPRPHALGKIVWIMLNPSTADEQKLDPTLMRCWKWSVKWTFDEMVIVNLFAFRSPHPKVMQAASNPIGNPANDRFILEQASGAAKIICAWGLGGAFMQRGERVTAMLQAAGLQLHCLGRVSAGFPIHPLARGKHRVPDSATPIPFP